MSEGLQEVPSGQKRVSKEGCGRWDRERQRPDNVGLVQTPPHIDSLSYFYWPNGALSV